MESERRAIRQSERWTDDALSRATKIGAFGGKVNGAGKGRFILVIAKPELHEKNCQLFGSNESGFQIPFCWQQSDIRWRLS